MAFGLDGVSYEIDLSDTNASALRDALADYVAHARRSGGRRSSGRRSETAASPAGGSTGSSTGGREQSRAIREWARGQGMEVSERGRIPASVTEAFHRNH